MGHFYRTALIAAVLATLPCQAASQAILTEDIFLAALGEDHPAIIALSDRLSAAEGARAGAGRLANPRLAAAWELPEETTQQETWSVAWTPPLDGRRGLRVRASEAALDAAKADFEAAELETRVAMRAVFAEWAISAERRAIVAAHHESVARLVAQMSARAKSGEASGLSARRLALAELEIEASLARAAADEASARQRAAAWSAIAESASPARPDLPEAPADVDVSAKPQIRARESELAAAEYDKRLAGRFLEFPELEAGWQKQEDVADETFSGPVFGASWPLPLFDRQQGDRAQTNRRVVAAQARLDFAKTLANAEVDATRDAYVTLRESALRSIAAIAETDVLIEGATASYTLGESDLTDLLETLRSVLAARMAALDLYEAALEAHRDLELAVGRPLSSGGGQ